MNDFYLLIFGMMLLAILGNGAIFYLEKRAERNNKRSGVGPTIFVGVIVIILFFGMVQFFVHRQNIRYEENQKPIYLEDKYYNKAEFISVNSKDIDNMKNENYVLYIIRDSYFTRVKRNIVEEYMKKHEISFLIITSTEYEKSSLNFDDKKRPNIVIVRKGHVKDYLDRYMILDEDLETLEGFEKWIEKNIYNTKSQ